MTPEERANEVCRLFGIQPAGPDEGDWPHRLQARMAKAIREAEAAAYERAAETLDKASAVCGDQLGICLFCAQRRRDARAIRSLALAQQGKR